MTILVAGSDTGQINRIATLLRQEGQKVLMAYTGADALRLAQTRPIDLILLDPLLSRDENDDFDRRLEQSSQAALIKLPVADDSTQFRGLELGLDPRIVTALREADLLKQVHAALQQRRRAAPKRIQPTMSALPKPAPAHRQVQPASYQTNEPPIALVSPLSISTSGAVMTWSMPKFTLHDLLNPHPIIIALFYLFLIFTAEYLTFSPRISPQVGLTLHGATIMLLLAHAALRWQQPIHYLLLGLIAVPMTRILSLSMPVVGVSRLDSYLGVAIPLLITAVMSARVMGFRWTEVGLNLRQLPLQIMIAPAGLMFGYIYYLILKPIPLITELVWPDILLQSLIIIVSTGFTEELIYRGILQRAATKIMGRFSIIYIAGLYAALHIGWREPLNPICAFILSLFLGWMIEKTRSLLGIALCHGLTNVMLLLIMPFLF
jgi:uncharacterized protein